MMIAPPERDIELGGCAFRIRPPERAIDVLEADVFLSANAVEHMRAQSPRSQDLIAIQRWCAAHVVAVDGLERDGEEVREIIDCELDYGQLTDLRVAIIELGGLPDSIVEQVKRFWYIARSGGCECAVCTERREDTEENRKRFRCMFGEMDPAIDRIVSSTYAMGDTPPLDAPWWLYQLQQAQASGRAKAISEEREEKKRRQSSTKVMKSRGYI